MDAVAVLPLFEQLRQWLSTWISIQKDRSQRESEAVRALLAALTKTQVYPGSEEHKDKPDRKREEELARAWSEAAAAFYGVASDIAPLLQLKSESWAQPGAMAARQSREGRNHNRCNGRSCASVPREAGEGGVPLDVENAVAHLPVRD
jgi:hypothetical protein